MAQLNVRLPDDFYKQVQRVVNLYLEMDLSTFVRELFIDTILIYEGGELPLTEKALAAVGQKHRIMGPPALLLTMADYWREQQEFWRDLEEEPTELEKKMETMTPEELVNYLRQRGMAEETIKAVVLNRGPSPEEVKERIANDPEMIRIDKMTKEEREKYLMDRVWDRMVKARRERRRERMAAEKKFESEGRRALPARSTTESRSYEIERVKNGE